MIGPRVVQTAINRLVVDKGDSSLWEQIGGRIYDTLQPQTAALPCIVVAAATMDVADNFLGNGSTLATDIDGTIAVRILAPPADEDTQTTAANVALVGALSAKVRAILNGYQFHDDGFGVTFIQTQDAITTITDEAATAELLFDALGAICTEV